VKGGHDLQAYCLW